MMNQTFTFPGQSAHYKGKVRDVYTVDNLLVLIASNRISAFDVILPRPIPYKGQVLNQLAARMLEATKDICPNWLLSVPAAQVSIGKKCEPIMLEMVVRGNLSGHAWRTYAAGKRKLCGVMMEEGLRENDFFSTPIITPSTKAHEGHDEDISADEILARNIVSPNEWEILQHYSLQLFARGKQMAAKNGLILVDTKYEFGKIGNEIFLIDEIHTPDSSRYFVAENFDANQQNGLKQKQLSKEFVREWLIENNFMGQDGQSPPPMSDEWVKEISDRYIELYEKVLGEKFVPVEETEEEMFDKAKQALILLGCHE